MLNSPDTSDDEDHTCKELRQTGTVARKRGAIMCQSQREGGQRCASHARERLVRASADLRATAQSDDRDRRAQALSEWDIAAAEYASTPTGRKDLLDKAQQATAAGQPRTAAMYAAAVRRGDTLRLSNQEVAARLRAAVRAHRVETDSAASEREEQPIPPYPQGPDEYTSLLRHLHDQAHLTDRSVSAQMWERVRADLYRNPTAVAIALSAPNEVDVETWDRAWLAVEHLQPEDLSPLERAAILEEVTVAACVSTDADPADAARKARAVTFGDRLVDWAETREEDPDSARELQRVVGLWCLHEHWPQSWHDRLAARADALAAGGEDAPARTS